MPPPSAPRRRRIIDDDDSDADERGGPVLYLQVIPTPPDAAPAANPAEDIVTVSSDSGSYDSDDPISRKARKISCLMAAQRAAESNAEAAAAQREPAANAAALTPFQYAAKFGHFPKREPAVPQPQQQPEDEPHNDGFLWNARPPARSQYLDEEAAHVGSSTSGTSGSSEGSLDDDDFIDKSTPTDFTAADVQQLQLLFPVTYKRFCPVAAQPVFSKLVHHHRVAVVAGSIANTVCSNCKQRKVGNEVKKCGFNDWCFVCDESLWSTNPEEICMRTTASQAASKFHSTPLNQNGFEIVD